MSNQTVTVRDRRSTPFVLIEKAFFQMNPTAHEIAAYCAVLYYANNRSKTCERIPTLTLAKRAGLSESSMKRAIAALQKKGALRVRHRSQKSREGNKIPLPNLYEILELNPVQEVRF